MSIGGARLFLENKHTILCRRLRSFYHEELEQNWTPVVRVLVGVCVVVCVYCSTCVVADHFFGSGGWPKQKAGSTNAQYMFRAGSAILLRKITIKRFGACGKVA